MISVSLFTVSDALDPVATALGTDTPRRWLRDFAPLQGAIHMLIGYQVARRDGAYPGYALSGNQTRCTFE
jgi:hypothetical protein